MNRKRRFYALLCLCAALLVCMPTAEAASVLSPTFLSVDGADLGAGDLGEQKEPEGSSQQDTSSSSSAADGKTQQQQQLTDLNQQIKDLKDQQAQIQDKIDAAKNEKEQAKLEKDNIDSQIYNTQEQIQLTNQKIALLKDNIAKANQDAQALEVDIDVQYEQFKSQIRNSYMSPSYSFLEYLFGSESFADFSVRMETVARISAYDQKVIDDLEHEIRELELTQASLEADMQSLQQSNEELEELQGQLSVQSQEAQEYIEDINAMEKEFLADKEEMQALQKQIQAEITQIYASLNASSSTNSEYLGDGTWAWPVPGYTYISSPYGWRFPVPTSTPAWTSPVMAARSMALPSLPAVTVRWSRSRTTAAAATDCSASSTMAAATPPCTLTPAASSLQLAKRWKKATSLVMSATADGSFPPPRQEIPPAALICMWSSVSTVCTTTRLSSFTKQIKTASL